MMLNSKTAYYIIQNTLGSQPDNEDVDEIEEDDRVKFCDQLCSVGTLGRLIPEHSIAMVTRWVTWREGEAWWNNLNFF